jgi:hypothetical protein
MGIAETEYITYVLYSSNIYHGKNHVKDIYLNNLSSKDLITKMAEKLAQKGQCSNQDAFKICHFVLGDS